MKRFENLGTALSRSQAKTITGGDYGGGTNCYQCTFTRTDGATTVATLCGNNGESVQCAADSICWGDDSCSNVDCAGSGACG